MTYLAFSIIWSIGANLHDDSRLRFSAAFKSEITQIMPEFPDGDIYEYGIDPTTHKFEPWSEQVPGFEFNPN
jgi:dynein heavy chain